jgi:hypothetical protein
VDPLEDNEKPGRPEREKTEHREEVGARSERERKRERGKVEIIEWTVP